MGARRTTRLLAALVMLAAVVNVMVYARSVGAAGPPAGGAPPPPPEVAVVVVEPGEVTLTTELPGRICASLVAEVRPQVNGIVQKRLFTEGSDVEAGELLYEIDAAPYQAAYDTAVAALARAEANVRPLELRAKRQKDLVQTGALSQQDYDEVIALIEQAKAEVEYSKAAVKSARINLEYTHVTAPISGRIGRSNVTVGALATAHQGPAFATIQQLDPIYVDVTQSTAQLQRLRTRFEGGLLSRDEATANTVHLILDDGTAYGPEGTMQFRDVTVDPSTGSVVLRMLFPNPDELLLPGMFARAVVTEGVNKNAILVPQQTVSHTPKGEPLVLIVDSEEKVEQRKITLDRALKDTWLVSSGLAPGERVIVEGSQRVRPGTAVTTVPWEEAATPPAEGAASPESETSSTAASEPSSEASDQAN